MRVGEQVSVEETPDDEQLWLHMGLINAHQRNQADQLMRVKARMRLADLDPLSRPCVALVVRHLDRLEQAELDRRMRQREHALAIIDEYVKGVLDLGDLITKLHELNGDGPDDF